MHWLSKPLVWLRALYDWTLSWADRPFALPALFVLALLEASFFPIPPDVLLMALALSRPKRGFTYALVCTAGSVTGAALGWGVGLGLWASLGTSPACPQYGGGAWLFDHIPGFGCAGFERVANAYQGNAWLALFTAAFTPIPFKIFTIAAGVFQLPLTTLLAASSLGRGARFFLVAGLIYAFGPPIKTFIEKRFEVVTVFFTAILIGGIVMVRYVL